MSTDTFRKNLVLIRAMLITLFLNGGCITSSADEDSAQSPPKRVRYELHEVATVTAERPLPLRRDFQVVWMYSNGERESFIGFETWDFNHDGRYEMVTELNSKGEVLRHVFDFDSDGTIDLVKSK